MPVPRATHIWASSAKKTGTSVVRYNNWSILRKSELPPDKTMPLSTMSEANSGGVSDRTFLMALIITSKELCRLSVTSSELTKIVLGSPVTISRPLASMVSLSSKYKALPILIFISSAGGRTDGDVSANRSGNRFFD